MDQSSLSIKQKSDRSRGDRSKSFDFNVKGVGYEGSYLNGKIYLTIGGLREYKHNSRSERRWKFLQSLFQKYESFKIREIHLAVDIPYRYDDIKVTPDEHVFHPKFKSTRYFDKRRTLEKPKIRGNDSFVIYDKCRKCILAQPLTRIELRLDYEKLPTLMNMVSDPDAHQAIIQKLKRHFKILKVKKNRRIVNIMTAFNESLITIPMQFIEGDDSLLPLLLGHRREDILDSSKLFEKFIAKINEYQVYSNKPQRSPKLRPYLDSLSPEERKSLSDTVMDYNRYDTKWHTDPRFKISAAKPDKNMDKEKTRDEALFLESLGHTQKEISEKLGVSESTVSRMLSNLVYIKGHPFLNIFALDI